MPREVTIPAETYTEEIKSYTVYSDGAVGVCVARGEVIPANEERGIPERFKQTSDNMIRIDGEDAEALLSDSPPWHPEKRGNMFEKNDLWYAIDAKRNNMPLEHGNARGAAHTPPAGNPNA